MRKLGYFPRCDPRSISFWVTTILADAFWHSYQSCRMVVSCVFLSAYWSMPGGWSDMGLKQWRNIHMTLYGEDGDKPWNSILTTCLPAAFQCTSQFSSIPIDVQSQRARFHVCTLQHGVCFRSHMPAFKNLAPKCSLCASHLAASSNDWTVKSMIIVQLMWHLAAVWPQTSFMLWTRWRSFLTALISSLAISTYPLAASDLPL